jgi:hypothetical protein
VGEPLPTLRGAAVYRRKPTPILGKAAREGRKKEKKK